MPDTTITAHSGCEGIPRDSLDAIELAAQLGADAVELDIRIDGDRVLRISHDPCTDGAHTKQPTLAEAFARLRVTSLKLNCDLKEARALYAILEMAEQNGFDAERLMLTGCLSPEQLVRDASIAKRANVLLNIEEALKFLYLPQLMREHAVCDFARLMNNPWRYVRSMPADAAELDALIGFCTALPRCGLNMPHGMLSVPLAEALSAQGLPFSVWTVNEADEIERCIRLGAANVTTLTVRTALAARERAHCV